MQMKFSQDKKGMAKGNNKMVWVEETALYCTVRMRMARRGEEKGLQKQKPVWLMYYCRLHWYIGGTKKMFCLETRYWPMGGRHPIHPVESDIHFTHWTKPKSPTVCVECSSSLLQNFTDLEKHVAPCGSVSHNPLTKVCCTIFLLQARTGYKCN